MKYKILLNLQYENNKIWYSNNVMIKIKKYTITWNLKVKNLWFYFNKRIKITFSRDGWSPYYVDALILTYNWKRFLKKRKD